MYENENVKNKKREKYFQEYNICLYMGQLLKEIKH